MYPSHQPGRNQGNIRTDRQRGEELRERQSLRDAPPSHLEMVEAAKWPSEAWPVWMQRNAFNGGAR